MTAASPPAGPGPRLGPRTGDFDAGLVVLGRIADRQAAERATVPFPVHTGPRTGETAAVEEHRAAERDGFRWFPGGGVKAALGWNKDERRGSSSDNS